MPSAMSRPSEPVETVSTSRFLSLLPSRMIEPLPKLRSIWESAASRAFDLSMDEEPSTTRSAVCDWAIAAPPYDQDSVDRQCKPWSLARKSSVHHLFQVRNMFFFWKRVLAAASTLEKVLAPFHPRWSLLDLRVAPF